MRMNKFKAGDKVKIAKCSGEDSWYRHHIGYEYTIGDNPTTLVERKYWYTVEYPERTIFGNDIELVTTSLEKDIVLVQKGEKEVPNSQTEDAILHLQSLVDLTGDDVEIIIRENELFVKAFGKQFYCENADVLKEAVKAAAFLSRQEIV